MSIMNVFVRPDHAFVGVDTECRLEDGRFVEISKMLPLPHAHAVFAWRGSVLFGVSLIPFLMSCGANIDELADAMPSLLSKAMACAMSQCDEIKFKKGVVGRAECVLVGYSASKRTIVAHHFEQKECGAGFGVNSNFECLYAPFWNDGVPAPSSLNINHDTTGMINLSLAQARLIHAREEKGSAAGGGLIVAEINRSRITIERVTSFPPREARCHQIEQASRIGGQL